MREVTEMSYYYVTHPNLDISATIEAPTTEKSRTTFLDYLERQGIILRGQRNLLRENMVAERLNSPESVLSDIELHYGLVSRGDTYQDVGRVQLPEPESEPEREELSMSQTGEMVEVPLEQRGAEPQVSSAQRFSPIARVSLGMK